MFKTVDELKKFILWAKSNKIKKLRIKDIEVEISELDFLPDTNLTDPSNFKEVTDFEKKTMIDTEKLSPDEEEELMFWSTNK